MLHIQAAHQPSAGIYVVEPAYIGMVILCFFIINQPSLRAWFGQKYVRKLKGAVKMHMTVLKMCITCKQKCDRNVCELWMTECVLFRLQS